MNLVMLICRRNGAAKGERLVWKLVHKAALANRVKLSVLWRSVPFCTWGSAACDLPQQNITEVTWESRDYLGGITDSAPSRCPSSPLPCATPRLGSARVPALQGLSHLDPSPGTADDGFPSNLLCLSFTKTPLQSAAQPAR